MVAVVETQQNHAELLDVLDSFCLPGAARPQEPETPNLTTRRPGRRGNGSSAGAQAEASSSKKRPRKLREESRGRSPEARASESAGAAKKGAAAPRDERPAKACQQSRAEAAYAAVAARQQQDAADREAAAAKDPATAGDLEPGSGLEALCMAAAAVPEPIADCKQPARSSGQAEAAPSRAKAKAEAKATSPAKQPAPAREPSRAQAAYAAVAERQQKEARELGARKASEELPGSLEALCMPGVMPDSTMAAPSCKPDSAETAEAKAASPERQPAAPTRELSRAQAASAAVAAGQWRQPGDPGAGEAHEKLPDSLDALCMPDAAPEGTTAALRCELDSPDADVAKGLVDDGAIATPAVDAPPPASKAARARAGQKAQAKRKPRKAADFAKEDAGDAGQAQAQKRPRKASDAAAEDGEDAKQAGGTASKRYRQAQEEAGSDGSVVEVLCFSCRRTKDTTVQKSMASFFKAKKPVVTPGHSESQEASSGSSGAKSQGAGGAPLCARCRRPMVVKGDSFTQGGVTNSLKGTGALPQLKRIQAYKRTAAQQGVPYLLSERAACAVMREPCVCCGAPAPPGGNGLTRLRKWPEGTPKPERGGYMGPYVEGNVKAACTKCNMMKGYLTTRGFVERCRHIASKHTPGEHFGEYPCRFRDNVSKRSRSGYITCSTTHTKTHAITNEDFNRIVAQRCYYCHKEPRAPKTLGPDDRGHFNGLDRLDSTHRVYTTESTVACCGDCNVMKFRWPLDGFLEHVRTVARFHVGRDLGEGEVAEGEAPEGEAMDGEAAEAAEGEAMEGEECVDATLEDSVESMPNAS